MSQERFEQKRKDLVEACRRLEEACQHAPDEFIRDATIQRFEFCVELLWKALKIYLDHEGLSSNSPRETLKNAFKIGLISSPEAAELYLRMLEDRNLTSHTYHEDYALKIYERIAQDYLPLFRALIEKIKILTWKDQL